MNPKVAMDEAAGLVHRHGGRLKAEVVMPEEGGVR